MSDVMRNTDIEDVLSSVRRLVANVSEDMAEDVDATTAATAEDVASGDQGALLLTAADRVQDTGSPDDDSKGATPDVDPVADAPRPAEDAAEPAPSNDVTVPFRLSARAQSAVSQDRWNGVSLEDRIAELEAAVSKTEQEWEPDGSETAPPPRTFDELEAGNMSKRPDPFEAAWTEKSDKDTQTEQGHGAPVLTLHNPATPPSTPPQADNRDDAPHDAADMIDDTALRALVMGILQDEMQGALGDRIAREIRALMAQGATPAASDDPDQS